MLLGTAEEREHRYRVTVARLHVEPTEVDRSAIEARGRSCLEPALRKVQLLEPCTERECGRIAGASGRVMTEPDVNQTVQKSAGGDDDRPCPEPNAELRDRTDHAIAFHQQIVDRLLKEPEIRLVFEAGSNGLPVEHPVSLGPGGADGRSLTRVEDAELDACFIGGGSHCTAKCIDLFDQVPLSDPADRRIAGHLTEGLDVVRQKQRPCAHPRCNKRSLGTGMATADNAELLALSGLRSPYPGKLGVVQQGALADLLLVDGDPLATIRLIEDPARNFVVIMKDGKIFKNTLQ